MRRNASAAGRPSNILERAWQDKHPQFSLLMKFWRLAPQESSHIQRVHDVRCTKATIQRVHDVRCTKATASCRPQIWKSKATAQEDPCRSTQRTGRKTVRSTTQRINFKDTTYLCVLASSVWRWHDTWSTRTAIRNKKIKKDSIKVRCGGQKEKKLASVRRCSNQLRSRGRASGAPWAQSSRRSVPIETIIDLSRPQPRPRRSEIEQAPFWILDRRPVLIRPEEVYRWRFLGSTERKGWLACLTAGFRLKVGGDVVALAK